MSWPTLQCIFFFVANTQTPFLLYKFRCFLRFCVDCSFDPGNVYTHTYTHWKHLITCIHIHTHIPTLIYIHSPCLDRERLLGTILYTEHFRVWVSQSHKLINASITHLRSTPTATRTLHTTDVSSQCLIMYLNKQQSQNKQKTLIYLHQIYLLNENTKKNSCFVMFVFHTGRKMDCIFVPVYVANMHRFQRFSSNPDGQTASSP